MNRNTLKFAASALVFSGLLFGNASCSKSSDDTNNTTPTPVAGTVEKSGSITASETWTANNKYLLKGYVYVRSGATITIEPGTIIKGDKDSKGTLIIEPGAKLIAAGTAAKPIVFTSNQPKGSRTYGDWGGVILCGNAPVNTIVNGVKPVVEGGPTTAYGGTDAADNSGSLQYVRIEFGGIAFSPNNEINGLTLCGVGNGTTLDHIQVSFSGDDSFEWFGGNVNAKYLIAHRGWDDDFDTDAGFSGKVQFGVSLRDPQAADQSGSKGFESDNDAGNSQNSPRTAAVFSNMTLVGPLLNTGGTGSISAQYVAGAHLRRNTSESIFNSVIMGWPAGVLLDGTNVGTNVANGDLRFQNNLIAGSPSGPAATHFQKNIVYIAGAGGAPSLTPTSVSSADTSAFGAAGGPMAWLYAGSNKNRVYNTVDNVRLTSAFNLTAPNFVPTSSSPVVYGGTPATTPAISPAYANSKVSDPFFTQVSYIGAFSGSGSAADNWASGWTNFDPNNTEY